MKRKKGLLITILMIGLMLGAGGRMTSRIVFAEEEVSTNEEEVSTNEEETSANEETAASENESVTVGLTKTEGFWYYYEKDGTLYTGWKTLDGSRYYFRPTGKGVLKGSAVTGLKKIDGYWYYFTKSGKLCTGWKTIEGNKYYFKPTGKGIMKGSAVTGLKKIDGYRYYFTKSGKLYIGWKTIEGNKYYFRPTGKGVMKGSAVTGTKKIDGYRYFFNSRGVMQKNKIVGSQSEGYFYVDDSGKAVTENAIQLAVDFVMAHSNASLSDSARLDACFRYMRSTYSYLRYYGTPSAADLSDYAVSYFTKKCGNCYRFAASFACIAKVLGYETRVAVGKIAVSSGMTAHGWAEVKVNGTWYVCDVGFNVYMKTISACPRRLAADNRYTLTTSNGKTIWKKNR